jgi:NAD(P)-dependent dehydrogenase (short-subunit alcohol dehydrogenase family)
MDMQLNDKTAWVTGTSVGIGKGIALALAAEGVQLANLLAGRTHASSAGLPDIPTVAKKQKNWSRIVKATQIRAD